jgi:predicted HTH transcriptional regulator
METAVLKSIAVFLKTNGGTLIIGVADGGSPIGLEPDGCADEDKLSLHL